MRKLSHKEAITLVRMPDKSAKQMREPVCSVFHYLCNTHFLKISLKNVVIWKQSFFFLYYMYYKNNYIVVCQIIVINQLVNLRVQDIRIFMIFMIAVDF